MEITETYGFRVSYAEFNGIDDRGNGSISLSSLYTLQSPLSRKFQFVEMLSQIDMHISKCTGHPVHFRLSKKSSFCWAFSIFYDIIHMGDENA